MSSDYHRGEHPFEHVERIDDDWKYVENVSVISYALISYSVTSCSVISHSIIIYCCKLVSPLTVSSGLLSSDNPHMVLCYFES